MVALQARMSETSKHVALDVLKWMMREPQFTEALKLYGIRVQAHDPHANHDIFQFFTTKASE